MTFAKKWSYGVPEFAETEVNQHFGKTLATHVAPPVKNPDTPLPKLLRHYIEQVQGDLIQGMTSGSGTDQN